MPEVLNRHAVGVPPGAVYVGRPTKWGNPFVIGRDGDRGDVLVKYGAWLQEHTELDPLELAGKDLVCWCEPDPCHADILLALANPDL